MALDVYFRCDIERGILAITVAKLNAAAAHENINIEYCRGVVEAAEAYALMFGVPWSKVRDYLTIVAPQEVYETVLL